MNAAASPRREPTELVNPSAVPHCAQCGDRLDADPRKAHPTRERSLCVDCAFDDIPCTD